LTIWCTVARSAAELGPLHHLLHPLRSLAPGLVPTINSIAKTFSLPNFLTPSSKKIEQSEIRGSPRGSAVTNRDHGQHLNPRMWATRPRCRQAAASSFWSDRFRLFGNNRGRAGRDCTPRTRDVAGWSMVATRRGGRSNASPMPPLGVFRSPLVRFRELRAATEHHRTRCARSEGRPGLREEDLTTRSPRPVRRVSVGMV
jgi:hypothetical protein